MCIECDCAAIAYTEKRISGKTVISVCFDYGEDNNEITE